MKVRSGYRAQQGVTLIEIMLVIVIISALFMIFVGYMQQRTAEMQRSRTILQMQQILNAGLAYYVNNGKWPGPDPAISSRDALDTLKKKHYLPETLLNNSWGQLFVVPNGRVENEDYRNMLYLYSDTLSVSNAQLVAGKLPLAFITNKKSAEQNPPALSSNCVFKQGNIDKSCTYVVTMINIPGQNLNNANAVTFANIYHANACVPAPVCPGKMVPTIMVIPVSISGKNDQGQDNIYPIESFTGFAVGVKDPITQKSVPGKPDQVPGCYDSNKTPGCYKSENKDPVDSSLNYWRVCAQVMTEKGDIRGDATQPDPQNPEWGKAVSLLAITRCSIEGEPIGSDFTVWKEKW